MIKKFLKNKTVGNIGIYTVLNFLNSAIPFLLLPILTKNLSVEEYGIVDIFNNLTFIFLPLIGLNIGASIIRFYYDSDEYDISKFISSSLLFLIGSGIALFVLLYTSKALIVSLFSVDELYVKILLASFLYAFFNQITEYLLSIYRAQERAAHYGVVRVCKTLLDFGVSAILIVFVFAGWESRVYPAIAISCLFSLISIFLIAKEIDLKWKYDWQYVKIALGYCTPLILHSMGGYIMGFADRLILLDLKGLEAVGLYGAAYQVGMIMSFAGNSFNKAWTPYMFIKLKEDVGSKLKKMRNINHLVAVFFVLLALVVYAFVPLIYEYLIGEEFKVDSFLIFIILMSYAINSAYRIYVNYLFFYKKTIRLSLYTLISAVLNVVLCYILIPKYDLFGAAYATFLAMTLQFVLVYMDYRRLSKI